MAMAQNEWADDTSVLDGVSEALGADLQVALAREYVIAALVAHDLGVAAVDGAGGSLAPAICGWLPSESMTSSMRCARVTLLMPPVKSELETYCSSTHIEMAADRRLHADVVAPAEVGHP
jgi:hypothetical protein